MGARIASAGGRAPRRDRPLQLILFSDALVLDWPWATLSFYTVVICQWLPFLRDVHINLAVIVVVSVKMTVSPWGSPGSGLAFSQ